MSRRLPLFILALILTVSPLWAQKKKSVPTVKPLSGLYITVDAGLLVPSDKQANFYNGDSRSPNRLERVLKSEMYGTQIWNDLVDQGLISPSAIHDYGEFEVAEYANMYYRLTFQLGVGFRYVYDNGWGWLMRFDMSEVTAAGQFLLSSNNGSGILGRDDYVKCGIYGRERRVLIDIGITRLYFAYGISSFRDQGD